MKILDSLYICLLLRTWQTVATQIDSNIHVTLRPVDVIFLLHNIQNLPNTCRGIAQTSLYTTGIWNVTFLY